MDDRLTLLYAALKSGFIKNSNILNAYFSIFAHLIINNRIDVLNETEIAKMFTDNYGIPVTEPFVRQVLGVGLECNAIENVQGQYKTNFSEMKKYVPTNSDFDKNWDALISGFLRYARKKGYNVSKEQADDYVLEYVNDNSKHLLREADIEVPSTSNDLEYVWCKYLEKISNDNNDLFEFVTFLNLTNIYKDAVFYTAEKGEHFKGLNVYLDTPLVLAILGMDSENRKISYLKLIEDAQKVGCNFFIFDNNFDETMGILVRASQIAFSNSYKLNKANKVAQFFHNTMSDRADAEEFIANVESNLNNLNIFVKETNYDFSENSFQEDEQLLFDMVSTRYKETGSVLTPERERSIQVDVRSIIMVYRERKDRHSSLVGKSHEIFITINSVIANVSKLYESNRSINAGHIPAAISADLLGTLVWLHKPNEVIEYKKKQLIADCYSAFHPNKELLEKYLQSLEDARLRDEITEDKYLLLRNHPLVSETLMNVISGDYSRFSDRTYIDVYNEIVEMSRKELNDEKEQHLNTQKRLEETEENFEKEKKEHLADKEHANAMRSSSIELVNKGLNFVLIWLPIITLLTVYEVISSKMIDDSMQGYIFAAIGVVATIVIIPCAKRIMTGHLHSFSERIVDKRAQKHYNESQNNE